MATNVFVLGLTEFQTHELETIRHAERYEFHDLVGYERIHEADPVVFADLLDQARAELAAFDGSIDAIIAHWDFPTSVLAPILAHEHGIPGPTLESVLKCEHKYWSRLEQRASVPEHVPAFCAWDPSSDDPLGDIDLEFPFWVKPVKSHSSHLGFRVEDADDFAAALEEIRDGIHEIGDAFDEALQLVDRPAEIVAAPGTTCLAEQIITGMQAAPEGSMFRGRFDVHGLFDMHKDERGESFERYDYPARLVPDDVQKRMVDVAEQYLRHVGFDNGCFNVEYLWDEVTDQLWVIEVNTRMSQSHSDLFAKVDGMSNHEIAVDIALGREPNLPEGEGEYDVASKCMILHRDDGVVTRVPTEEEIEALAARFPGTEVELGVEPGDRLAELTHQDSYNYVLGIFFIGASGWDELEERRRQCLDALPFEFDPPPASESPS